MRSEIEARARFEEWRKTLQARPDLSRDGEYYEDHDTQVAWSGYQAALASQGEQHGAGDALAALGVSIGEAAGTRVSLHLTRAKQIYAALATRQPVGQEPVIYQVRGPRTTHWQECDREMHESEHKADGVETRALYTVPPAQPQASAAAVLQEAEARTIESLLGLAYAAWNLADNAAGRCRGEVTVQRADFDNLSARLDELDELPDDQPGYTMEAAAKARWALRRLLAAAPVPEVDRAADG